MKCHPLLSKLAKRGTAAFLLLAMLGLSANDAVAQVECTAETVANGTLKSVTFAAGAHVVESGAGLLSGSGTASVDNIPAGATIEEAFLYWAVRKNDGEPAGQIDLTVNTSDLGTVEGNCIGVDDDGDEGPSGTVYAFKYEIPTNELTAGAPNTVDVEVLDAVTRADGFSVVVLYSLDGSIGYSEFYEGADFIWDEIDDFSSSLTIEGSILEQCAGNDLTLHLKVGDVTDDRPHLLRIDIDESNFLEEYGFFGFQDPNWEAQWSDREVDIGEATSKIEIELVSEEDPANPGGDPSSLSWIVAGVTCSVAGEVAGCTRTPGYWRNNGFRSGVLTTALASAKIEFTDAFDGDPWASDLSVNDARGILNQNSCSDISYCLQKHLLASILNVANGATNTIEDTIEDAINFLDSDISVDAEDLKDTLDSFNNGLEGPPSCDTLEDEGNASPSALNRGQINHSVGPNPFNPSTLIHFELGESMAVRLAVYDILGREVRILLDETVNAGEHRVNFDANGLPTGTYFYRFVTPEGIFGGQMILMK